MRSSNVFFRRFTVRGKGPFPFDMLRYDSCFPTDGESAARMHYSRVETIGNNLRDVTLTAVGYTPCGGGPTVARWESFGWNVVLHHK